MVEKDNPTLALVPIDNATTIQSALSGIKRCKYTLRADIHYALNLPKEGNKYHVKVRWGQTEVITSKKEVSIIIVVLFITLLDKK